MKISLFSIILICIFISSNNNLSQVRTTNPLIKWSTWTLLQALPSVTFYEDNNKIKSSIRTGFQWQIIPFSYTFRTNKYISNLNFFYINPVKRFSGSAELYFEPEYVFGGFKYVPIKRFLFKSGIRTVFPLAQRGEYLSLSLGAGLSYQKSQPGEVKNTPTIETGIYSFFGMLGLKFNYNPNAFSKFSFGLYLKYY